MLLLQDAGVSYSPTGNDRETVADRSAVSVPTEAYANVFFTAVIACSFYFLILHYLIRVND
jgi:hypothetical protein